MGFLDDLGLLARHVPGDARNALKGLLAPVGQLGRGEFPSQNELANALMKRPVFDQKTAARDAYDHATGLFGTTKPYQGAHKPMTEAGGAARLHDVESRFGPDVFGPNALQYFGSGSYKRQEKGALDLMKKVRGNPDAEVTVYRGIPDKAEGKINPGDWVTLDPSIAREYGGQVVTMKVKAKDITSWPDSLVEYGYFPQP